MTPSAASHTIPTTPAPISREVAMQAAQWFVRLSESVTTADQQAFDDWLAADESHHRAWQRATAISAQAGALPAALASSVLRRPQSNAAQRRTVVRTLACLIVAAPAGWAAWQATPLQWRSDFATATGEQKEVTLPDGTRLLLDTASAVDVAFDAQRRAVVLRAGAVHIVTAPDSSASSNQAQMQMQTPALTQVGARPFMVLTDQGQVRAIGTQFTVRQYPQYMQVAVTEGMVEVTPRQQSQQAQRVHAGEETHFTAHAVAPVRSIDQPAQQWTRGMLAVENMPLADFAAELSRYRAGVIQCDPAIAGLRLTGAFQLADTDAILLNLRQLLPIQVRQRTRYWVTLVPVGVGAP